MHVLKARLPAQSSDSRTFHKESRMTLAKFGNHSNRLLRGEILRRWEQLTATDIEESGTDPSGLIQLLQTRYGYAERRAEKEVALFFGDFQDRLRRAA